VENVEEIEEIKEIKERNKNEELYYCFIILRRIIK